MSDSWMQCNSIIYLKIQHMKQYENQQHYDRKIVQFSQCHCQYHLQHHLLLASVCCLTVKKKYDTFLPRYLILSFPYFRINVPF